MKKAIFNSMAAVAIFAAGTQVPTTKSISVELEPQLIIPAKIVDVHDGDTLTVETINRVHVRLIDCWAKELKEDGGPASLENLRKNCPEGSEVLLQIPVKSDISRMFTFGRILGNVYKDGQNMGELQVRQGFATPNKDK